VPGHLVALLEQQAKMSAPYFPAHEMPIRLVVEYLRHAHHLFIRERLPFLMYLIGGMEVHEGPEKAIAQDLRMIFPLFAEEFIAHIHEEEDTLFTYIAEMQRASKTPANAGELWLKMARRTIGDFAAEHQVHDDEMEGIRALTDNYTVRPGMSLPLRVLYYELARFELDLASHARLENTVLMPKALRLEAYVRSCLAGLALKN
jgi:regulator of cell morphogenesis and NO signaling